jgi:uncharacterized metal-binding protein YceD (DUF177 family)
MTMSKKVGRPHSRAKARSGAASAPPWSVPLDADIIPETGLHREIAASAEICAAVARLAGVRAVSQLKASFDISRAGDIVQVTGRVTATVGQNCVVTLEPLETAVDEPIEVVFAPPPPEGSTAGEDRHRKTLDELPEPLISGTIDLGAIATEFLILGIEPYPRKEGVAFAPPEVDTEAPHPFAALEALKKRPGGDKP